MYCPILGEIVEHSECSDEDLNVEKGDTNTKITKFHFVMLRNSLVSEDDDI